MINQLKKYIILTLGDLFKKLSMTKAKQSQETKKLDYNAKTTEIENKIPSISGLAANSI